MISVNSLRTMLRCDFEAGKVYWLPRHNLPFIAGTEAGSFKPDGYAQVKVEGGNYSLHRIIWALYYGVWPISDLDHKDGNPFNNSITNLREATKSQNLMNAKIHSNNTSGYRGVSWYALTNKWRAAISLGNGKKKHLGYFDSIEDAIAVRDAAALQLHPEFARVS